MVNSGPHSNGSQFYMTLDALSWMDGKAVAFGYVVDGMRVLRLASHPSLAGQLR